MIRSALSLVGCAVSVVVLWCGLRAYVHRVAPAQGDPELAAELQTLVGRTTRSVAVAVLDLDTEPSTRFAFIAADKDTRFEIGSITKGLTGMLLAQAIERGELSMDTTVGTVIPGSAGSTFGSITARELCTHTSGLPRMARSPLVLVRTLLSALVGLDPYRGTTPSGLLDLAARQTISHRGRYHYSNIGAAVLGQLLATAAGTDYETLLRERVFQRLAMSASIVASRTSTAPRGWSSMGRRQQPWTLDGYAPAGGVVSTIEDMARLAGSLLDNSTTSHAALVPFANVATDAPNRATGMFWVINTPAGGGRTMVWHNGQTGGYSAFFALFPEDNRAVVVLANVAHGREQQRIALGLREQRRVCA